MKNKVNINYKIINTNDDQDKFKKLLFSFKNLNKILYYLTFNTKQNFIQ